MSAFSFGSRVEEVGKHVRIYHAALNQWGDVLHRDFDESEDDGWVTVRLDGEQGTRCYEVSSPYITLMNRNGN